MPLSQTAGYALRTIVWLARHPGHPRTTTEIAEATRIPSSYAPKVCQRLVHAGLVAGQRGLGGGYSLGCDPAEVSLLDVVRAVNPPQTEPSDEAGPSAVHGEPPHAPGVCTLTRLLDDLESEVERRLASTTVAQLATGPCGCVGGPPESQLDDESAA